MCGLPLIVRSDSNNNCYSHFSAVRNDLKFLSTLSSCNQSPYINQEASHYSSVHERVTRVREQQKQHCLSFCRSEHQIRVCGDVWGDVWVRVCAV